MYSRRTPSSSRGNTQEVELRTASLALLLRVAVSNAAASQGDLSLSCRFHHLRSWEAVDDRNDVEASALRAGLRALSRSLLCHRSILPNLSRSSSTSGESRYC